MDVGEEVVDSKDSGGNVDLGIGGEMFDTEDSYGNAGGVLFDPGISTF